MNPRSRKKVVVVGCGFAGTAAVRALSHGARRRLDIVAFDKQPCLYNYPVLPRLLNEDLPIDRVEVPLGRLLARSAVELRHERVAAIEPGRRIVHSASGVTGYDFLILAPGSRAIPIAQDDGLFVTYPKAMRHLRRLGEQIRAAATEAATGGDRAGPHRVAIIGGGLTGVEFAMAVREAADRACADLGIARQRIDVGLYERADRLNPLGPAGLSRALERELTAYGIGLHLQREIQRVSRQGLVTGAGKLPADTVVCCIGSRPNLGLEIPDLTVDSHGIAVDATLRCRDLEGTYVIGDGMLFHDAGQPRLDIRQAHRAAAQGRHAARNIVRLLHGRAPRAYRPVELPIGVMLQSRRGLFSYRNQCFSGTLAGRAKRWLELRHT